MQKISNNRLSIALQKKGRLNTDSIELLQACGIKLSVSKNALIAKCKDFPIDVLLVRDDDIPTLVNDAVCDLGIVGENVLTETMLNNKNTNEYTIIKNLSFSNCRLSISVQKSELRQINDINNLKIATSYPNILQKFLNEKKLKANIVYLSGSVEIAPGLGIADAICDLVSTGRTLEENNLKEIETVLQSQAVLIQAKQPLNTEKNQILDLLLQRINGVIRARETKYIMLHAPKSKIAEISALLPGSETPTIMPLGEANDSVAMHVVSSENVFWTTMEKLKLAGASSILVLPIEKMLR